MYSMLELHFHIYIRYKKKSQCYVVILHTNEKRDETKQSQMSD